VRFWPARAGSVTVPAPMRFLLGFLVTACAAPRAPAPAFAPPPIRSAQPAMVTDPDPEPTAADTPPRAQPKLAEPLGWVLPVDHGVRADRAGEGEFRAPRYHGMHNGVDLLAPLGTPVLSPCDGRARAGKNSSHGKWLHVACELPRRDGLQRTLWASFFFAHLSSQAFADEALHSVRRGETIGAVGKTGNASAASVAAHLHLEAIVHETEASALAERHSGRDQSDTDAAHELREAIRSACLEPNGFARRGNELWRARRVDPVVLLECFGADKPAYTRPAGEMAEASRRWSAIYTATSFDIDTEFVPSAGDQ
jgi:murein DD-endopeptidase MepM/ murein hydrolase activator NlpD